MSDDVNVKVKYVSAVQAGAQADKEKFKAAMGEMGASANIFGETMSKMALGVGTAFAGMFAISRIKEMVNSTLEWGKEIENTSRKFGMSTIEFQKLSYVAQQSGGHIESMARAISTMAKEAMKSNSIIGVATHDSNGSLKTQSQLFEELLYRIAEIPNPTERMAASMKVFGMAGREVFNIASQGKDRIHELMEETNKYGLILDKNTIRQLDEAKKAQERLDLSTKVLSASFVTAFAPAIITVSNELAKMFKWLGGGPDTSKEKHILEMQQDLTTLSAALKGAESTGTKSFATMSSSGVMLQHTVAGARAEIKMLESDIKKASIAETTPGASGLDLRDDAAIKKAAEEEKKYRQEQYQRTLQAMEMSKKMGDEEDDRLDKQIQEKWERYKLEDKLKADQWKKDEELRKKDLASEKKHQEELKKLKIQFATEAASKIKSIADNIATVQINNIESEKQSRLDLLNTTNMSEEAKAKKIEQINKEAAAKEREVKRQQQDWAVGSAFISGAQAVMKDLATYGYVVGGIMGLLDLGVMASEIAAIKSQKFASGLDAGPVQQRYGRGGTDSEPAMLTPGERVLTPAQYSSITTSSQSHHYDMSITVTGNADASTVRSIRATQHSQVLALKRTMQSAGRMRQLA
jgi:hypothetical protein